MVGFERHWGWYNRKYLKYTPWGAESKMTECFQFLSILEQFSDTLKTRAKDNTLVQSRTAFPGKSGNEKEPIYKNKRIAVACLH